MNPLTNIKNLNKLNENEIRSGHVGTKVSWHNQYRDSAWVFFGGMPFELTEGDIIIIFSQYGEIVNVNLIRDKKTGKSKGFGFVCYENQYSTDLAVDNFNGTKILGRIIRVDHVANYKPPKDSDEADEITKFLREEGCSTRTVTEKMPLTEDFDKKTELTDNKKQANVKQDKDDSVNIKRKDYDKEKDRDRYRDRDKERDRDREKVRERDGRRENDQEKDREKERDRDRDRNREREREKDRNRDNSNRRNRSRSPYSKSSQKKHKNEKNHRERD